MSLILHKRIYYVNSKNRLSGTSSNFLFSIQTQPQDNFDRCVVLQAVIPKTYYLIQSEFNTFQLQENTSTVTVTIPVGNYNLRNIQTVLISLLNTASPNGIVYSMSYPGSVQTDTGMFTFSCSNVSSIEPSFIFTDNGIAEYLGFQDNSTNTFTSFTLVSTNVINLGGDSLIYVHSDICSNGTDDVLQEIFATAGTPYFSNIYFLNPDIESYSKQLVSNQKGSFYINLTDQDGIPIDLNGIDMTITLMLYKNNDMYSMVKEYIKYLLHKENETLNINDQI